MAMEVTVMFNRKISRNSAAAVVIAAFSAWLFTGMPTLSQVINPGVQQVPPTPANNDCAEWVVTGGNVNGITTSGGSCGGASGANPTAVAGPNAVNGSAATFMRSDAAPAVQKGSASQFGILECSATDIICPSAQLEMGAFTGDVTKVAGALATTVIALQGNAVCSTAPTNGYVLEWSSGSSQWCPTALPKGTSSVFGILECNATDIICPSSQLELAAFTGDVVKTAGSLATTVQAVQGLAYKSGATYSNGQIPTWNSTNSDFEPSSAGSGTVTEQKNTASGGLTVSGNCDNTTTNAASPCNYALTTGRQTLPTVQTFTSGSAQTYTTPANALWLEVYACGGGAGGSGAPSSGSTLVPGTAGNTTTFNSINAAGGGAPSGYVGGAAGTGGTGSATRRMSGTPGANGGYAVVATDLQTMPSGFGGSSSLLGGGAQAVAVSTNPGNAGVTNSGGGGSGATNDAGSDYNIAPGGGGAECFYLLINNPSSTYTYTVAATAAGGSSSSNGGAGAAGYIQVVEHYN